jgi:hypothetical protein
MNFKVGQIYQYTKYHGHSPYWHEILEITPKQVKYTVIKTDVIKDDGNIRHIIPKKPKLKLRGEWLPLPIGKIYRANKDTAAYWKLWNGKPYEHEYGYN